jgi:ABC-type amino acid transport substrate-binding protein
MKFRSLIVAGAAITAFAVAPAAQATTITDTKSQSVSGVTSSGSLSIGTVAAAAFPTLGTSATGYTSTLGIIPVVAIGDWSMSVYGSNAGKLINALACGSRLANTTTTNALDIIPPTATLASTFTPGFASNTPLAGSGSPVSLGSGTGSNAINLNYKWTPDTDGVDADVLPAGCALSQTSTVTVSATF